jgi:hypothetical protein
VVKNAGHPDLIGVPGTVRETGVGTGGTLYVPLNPPVGQIWVVKSAVAYHDVAGGDILYWEITDAISGVDMELQHANTAVGVRYPFSFSVYCQGPLVVSPGGLNLRLKVLLSFLTGNYFVEAVVHKIYGVNPLV